VHNAFPQATPAGHFSVFGIRDDVGCLDALLGSAKSLVRILDARFHFASGLAPIGEKTILFTLWRCR
jgi:hypothetical protein